MSARGRRVRFWGLIAVVLVLDVVTKAVAERALAPRGIPHEVMGDWLRLTLVYNTGAAFGISLGVYSRWLFLGLAIIALVILGRLYRQTPDTDRFRIASIGLVCAGAVGNVIDRIRHPMGVVDFIDIGVGVHRWPTFNVADMAVSIGAFMLAWSLWAEDRARARTAAASVSSSAERA
ncbi:MAG: signal peptidase II [Gemmatimonadaceae bacterium]